MVEFLPKVFVINNIKNYLINVTSEYYIGDSHCIICDTKFPSIYFNGLIVNNKIEHIFNFGYFSLYDLFCKCKKENKKLVLCQIFTDSVPNGCAKSHLSEKLANQVIDIVLKIKHQKFARKRLVSVV